MVAALCLRGIPSCSKNQINPEPMTHFPALSDFLLKERKPEDFNV